MLAAILATSLALAPPPLPLVVHGPEPLARGFRGVTPGERFLHDLAALTGRTTAEQPIHVVLVPEDSPTARAAPSWVAGYALPTADTVVLFPVRAGSYPREGLDVLLRHELAHVVVSRAAGHQPLPRWLAEGLAMTASREHRLADRGRLLLAALAQPPETLGELDRELAGPPTRIGAAYALAAAFTAELLASQEPWFAASWLQAIAAGEEPEVAYHRLSGEALAVPAEAFFRRWRRLRWVPLLTSSAMLWLVITALALAAGVERRRRAAATLERWAEEDLGSGDPPLLH